MVGPQRDISGDRLSIFIEAIANLPGKPDGRDVDAVRRWQEQVKLIGRALWWEAYGAGAAYGLSIKPLPPVPVSCSDPDRCPL